MSGDVETNARIGNLLVRYIRKASMNEKDWRFTKLATVDERLSGRLQISTGERPVVSCFVDEDWFYLLTSQRVLGRTDGEDFVTNTAHIEDWVWGNFKRELRAELELAELTLADQTKVRLAYETGYASMAPIHYAKWWQIKYPILHKLTEDSGG